MKGRILDFEEQAEQMLSIIEQRLDCKDRNMALRLLVLKFKSIYELGVAGGKKYEREGVYPFMSIDDD